MSGTQVSQVPPALLRLWGRTPPLTSPASRAFSVSQVGLCLLLFTLSLWGFVCVFEDSLDLQGTLIQHGLVTIFGLLYMPIFKARAFLRLWVDMNLGDTIYRTL